MLLRTKFKLVRINDEMPIVVHQAAVAVRLASVVSLIMGLDFGLYNGAMRFKLFLEVILPLLHRREFKDH